VAGDGGRKERVMQKILVAYDGGEPARRALDMAAEMAKRFGASVSVVSVIPAYPGRLSVGPWDDTASHAHQLVEARTILREVGIEPDLIEPLGDPARTIERIADDGGFDAIIVGSRHLGRVRRAVEGSVSEHVATHAKATVVVAR
jgi:nucleotide-binding universal stress UspA family protein